MMDFDQVVKDRRSIRGYNPDPGTKEAIEEAIRLTVRVPYSMNTQPSRRGC